MESKRCKHIDYESVRFGVETGVMIGGATQCISDAIKGRDYCELHSKRNKENS